MPFASLWPVNRDAKHTQARVEEEEGVTRATHCA